MPRVGVLALQGDVREHVRALGSLGVETRLVKSADHLESVDALVIPGGESTTIGRLAERFDLLEPLRDRFESATPSVARTTRSKPTSTSGVSISRSMPSSSVPRG